MELLTAIKTRIANAQYEALKAVNKELIALYWDIGQLIVERQQNRLLSKPRIMRQVRRKNL